MKLPIRINCRPSIGIDNWDITIYDRRTNEVFLSATIHTDNIRETVEDIVKAVAQEIGADIEIL